jgi:hypothetical protein
MSSYWTPESLKVYAKECAAADYEYHIKNNVDLNPFSTDGARDDWQRGFDDLGPRSYETSVDFNVYYQRGRAAAEILKEKNHELQTSRNDG